MGKYGITGIPKQSPIVRGVGNEDAQETNGRPRDVF